MTTKYFNVKNGLTTGTLITLDATTGNGTFGNVSATNHTGTTANLTGQYITTLATGTAPLVVYSTTRVANLNVATAGTADSATTATTASNITTQTGSTNGTYYPVFVASGTPGAQIPYENTAFGYNPVTNVATINITGSSGSATTAATVTTAAQPNITSIGTLTVVSSSGNITGANIITTGYHIRSVQTGISAAGSTQGTATSITKEMNVVSTVPSGTGVILPSATPGMVLTITNTTANSLLVYPALFASINSLVSNTAFSQSGGSTIQFIAPTTSQWYTVGATYA